MVMFLSGFSFSNRLLIPKRVGILDSAKYIDFIPPSERSIFFTLYFGSKISTSTPISVGTYLFFLTDDFLFIQNLRKIYLLASFHKLASNCLIRKIISRKEGLIFMFYCKDVFGDHRCQINRT
ncbi:MAG: hypothetical protein QG670_863 [Thermoproteota archaeon]|nr:hypothetical protein [Thermoproteota archaeon]